jgi:hypothetical protein
MASNALRLWRAAIALVFAAVLLAGIARSQEPVATESKTDDGRVKRTLKLPAAVEDVVVAGSGKYLVAHLKSLQKLAVIDVKEAKVAKYVSAPGDVLFAAGAEHLFVVLKDQSLIQRWNLKTLERELATPLPSGMTAVTLSMGHASLGPVLVGAGEDFYAGGGFVLLDPKTLKALPAEAESDGRGFECYSGCVVRASANGQLFTSWRTGVSPAGFYTLVLSGSKPAIHYDHESRGLLLPSADGTRIYTNNGVFNNKTGPISMSDGRSPATLLPSVTGDYYLRITPPDYGYHLPHEEGQGTSISVHLAGDSRPIVTLTNLIPPRQERGIGGERWQSIDKRLFHFPDLSILAYLAHPDDAFEFLTLDLDAELEKSGIDFLFVSSRPPLSVEAGQAFDYQTTVKSKKGGVKVSLASGPEGMEVTPAGKATWNVPRDAAGDHDIILAVSDSSGQEVFQTFRLAVSQPTTPAPTAPKTASKSAPGSKTTAKPPAASPPAVTPPASAPAAATPADSPTSSPVAGKLPPITPAKLTGDKQLIKLPAAAEKMEVGGGGRYLILHLKSLRKLAVLDLCEAKIAGYVPAEDDGVAFAAGADKLVVSLNEKNILTRWDLATLERELAVPAEGSVSELVMGSASAGPLLVIGGPTQFGSPSFRFLDLTKLRPIDVVQAQGGFSLEARGGMSARASADGRTFCVPGSFGMGVMIYDGQKIRPQQGGHDAAHGIGIPSPDGQVIYAGNGRFSPQMRRLSGGDQNQFGALIPAAHGRFYLSVQGTDQFRYDGTQVKHKLAVHIEGDARPLVLLDDFNLFAGGGGIYDHNQGIPTDKRVVLVPDAKVIATTTPTFDAVELRRFDLDEALDASGIDYLFVTSRPPTTVKPSQEVSYQLEVKSKKGGVKYRLEAGPEGMTLSEKGLLAWQVPAETSEASQSVIVAVSDSAGQEVFHTFQIAVEGATPPKPATPSSPLDPLARLLQGAVPGLPMPGSLRPPGPAVELPSGTVPTAPGAPAAGEADPFSPGPPAAALSPPASLIGQTRTWTDADSGRTIEATFLGLAGGKVKAVSKEGKEVQIPLTRLTREDLLWLLGSESPSK